MANKHGVVIDRTTLPGRPAVTVCAANLRSPDGGPFTMLALGRAYIKLALAGVPEHARVSITADIAYVTWEEDPGAT